MKKYVVQNLDIIGFNKIRVAISCGAPMEESLLNFFSGTGIGINQIFGTVETGLVCSGFVGKWSPDYIGPVISDEIDIELHENTSEIIPSPIVTLTTDWGQRDFFVAAVKGKLYSLIPEVRITDLSHEEQWNDMARVRDMIRYGCPSFPPGTVHIIDVSCDVTFRTPNPAEGYIPTPVLVLYKGQYIICSELRPLQWALESMPDIALSLPIPEGLASYTFRALDLYCSVTARLINGEKPEDISTNSIAFSIIRPNPPIIDGNIVETKITGVDKYGNVSLDITYQQFESLRGDRRFRLICDNNREQRLHYDTIRRVSKHYNDVRIGTLLLTVSTTGYLQLAINGGSASQLLDLRPTCSCKIEFI